LPVIEPYDCFADAAPGTLLPAHPASRDVEKDEVMNITAKSIKEDLARSKAAYLKNEDMRAVATLASALKGFLSVKLASQDRTAVEGQFREAFSNLSKMPRVLKYLPKGVPYSKGQEEKLFKFVAALYKKIKQDIERESLEEMRERKLKIDQLIAKGQKFLDEGNLLEAQRNFREAVALHVDEDGLFPLVAMRLMDKGHHKAALEYLRGAIQASPDNSRAYDLLLAAAEKLGEVDSGLKVLSDAGKKAGSPPLLLAASAGLLAQGGKWIEAKAEAEKALATQPGLERASKILAQAARHLDG
jgi:tetratricopeptide (TPR) repeat protein